MIFYNVIFEKTRIYFFRLIEIIKEWPFISSILAGLIAKPAFTSREVSICLILSFEIFLIVLQSLFEKKKYLKSFFVGYVFGFFLYCGILYWETYLHDLQMPWLSFFKYVFYFVGVFYVAFFYAFATFFSIRLARNKISLIVYFSIFVTLGEMLNSYFFEGYPFTIIGYGTVSIPFFSQIATIFGSYGVTFFFIFILGLLNLPKYWKIGLVLYLLIFIHGFYLVCIKKDYLEHHNTFEVSVVEPNFNYKQRKKKRHYFNCDTIAKLADVNRYSSDTQKRLIVAPENVIWCKEKLIDYFVKTIAVNKNTYACTGFMEWLQNEKKDWKLYNSMHIYNNEGESIADVQKSHLLMFSEKFPNWLFKLKWIPITKFRKFLSDIENSNMREGNGLNTVKISGIDQFAANICYDIICPGMSMKDPLLSTWILNIINLHCYCSEKISDLAHQQNVNCRFRAIEFGKPILVCANYGYSCVIDCNGNIIKKLNPDQIGAIHQKFPLKYHVTTFCFYGQKLILFLLLFLFLLVFLIGLSKNKNIYNFLKNKLKF